MNNQETPTWLFIPIYGAIRAIGEHSAITDAHHRACDRVRTNPTPENFQTVNDLFAQSWPAMGRASVGLWITAGELVAIIMIGAIVVSAIT